MELWYAATAQFVEAVVPVLPLGECSLDVMRWGLVPFWAKDIKVGFTNINAKAEGMIEVFTANMTEKADLGLEERDGELC
jgi:putative SOS response-associated peptidase YedK